MEKDLEFHKQKLAEILKDIESGKAKLYSQKEFDEIINARRQKLLTKIANEKQASGQ